MTTKNQLRCGVAALLLCTMAMGARAQNPPPASPQPPAPSRPAFPPPTPNATLVSPDVLPDRHVVFRLYAPQAQDVRVHSEWAGSSGPETLTKADNGVWSVTVGPLDPGVYRYLFTVDGVETVDPRNPRTSESLNNVQSLLEVPGAAFEDIRDVPHGAVASVWYHSTALGATRRMHVYTPPGYEAGTGRYPVLYLLHGAGDTDEAWSTVGHAGFILDNLIADGKARPMIVVMPAGHISRQFGFGGRGRMGQDQFNDDFLQDIMPYVEAHYRVSADRTHRAIAGLSMGGLQTLNIALPHLDKFAYVGVFSSGWFGQTAEQIEQEHRDALDNAAAKKGLRLLWLAWGAQDLARPSSQVMLDVFQRHGFQPVWHESAGGHTWINWRDYLHEFAPLLFH
ncbi:MAG: esterase [Armatimonadetes bacterium]|nr:esterase [Armatimonadota bacterium]